MFISNDCIRIEEIYFLSTIFHGKKDAPEYPVDSKQEH